MRAAVLRGLAWGLAAFVFTAAVVEAAVLLDGGTWTEMLALALGLGVGSVIGPGMIAFLAHPGSKPLREKVEPWLSWLSWLLPRVAMGIVTGLPMYFVAFVAASLWRGMLGVPIRPVGSRPMSALEHAAFFLLLGMSAAAFAGSVMGGVLAPPVHTGKEAERPLLKHCAWVSIFGAIAGAWIGVGAGLLYATAIDWKRDLELDDDTEAVLAIAVGLIAGAAAAITLRIWRQPGSEQ